MVGKGGGVETMALTQFDISMRTLHKFLLASIVMSSAPNSGSYIRTSRITVISMPDTPARRVHPKVCTATCGGNRQRTNQ